MKSLNKISDHNLTKGINYSQYTSFINNIVNEGKTSGLEQTKEHIEFTKLNASRKKRLDKTIKLSEEQINAFKQMNKQIWLVITESWCGDAAQTLPILNKIAEVTPNIDLKIVFRDENEELMNAFLTNGAKAIPKLIIIDDNNNNNNILNSWGPRSKNATELVQYYKNKFGVVDAEFKKNLQIWYNKDKGISIINDLLEINRVLKPLIES